MGKKFFVPMKPTIIFAIRIKGINGISPRAKKILELLRLKRINNGVFLKLNPSSLQILKKIEPYVAYGYPTPRTVRNLINKRGNGKDKNVAEMGAYGNWDESINHLINKMI